MSPEPEEIETESIEQEVQQEPDKPRRIEIDPEELKELRNLVRQQRDELHQHKLLQMQQYQQYQHPTDIDIEVDKDVERVIAPVVKKALRPLEERNRLLESQLQQNAEQLRVQANIDYLERNIDNFDEIRPDIAKKIESLPRAEQDMVLSSPTLILEIANGINARRGRTTKQDSRSRVFSESSTGTSPSKNSSASNVDWSNLSDAEFAVQEAKIEQARRKR